MKWLAYAVVSYIFFVIIALTAIPAMVHRHAHLIIVWSDATGRYNAQLYEEDIVPFGPQPSSAYARPGFVLLLDHHGNVLGEKSVGDIHSFANPRWSADALRFTYMRGPVQYEAVLPLPD